MSFGFVVGSEEIDESGDMLRAHVTRIERLLEISPVNFPAYRDTNVETIDDADAEDEPAEDIDSDEEDRSWESDLARRRLHMDRYI